jgi:hypothetical protein
MNGGKYRTMGAKVLLGGIFGKSQIKLNSSKYYGY